MAQSLQFAALVRLDSTPMRPYKRVSEAGEILYEMVSFTGEGKVFYGSSGLAVALEGKEIELIEGRDFQRVVDYNVIRFKQGEADPLFDMVRGLVDGDLVLVTFEKVYRIKDDRKREYNNVVALKKIKEK